MKKNFTLLILTFLSIVSYSQSVIYSGPFTNTTYNLSGNVVIEIEFLQNGEVEGYMNFTEYPFVTTLCGAGNFTGTKSGANINLQFSSNDPDAGCGFDLGYQFEIVGVLENNDNTFRGNYYVITTGNEGIFETQLVDNECTIDLTSLQNDYNSKIGTNDEPYAFQYLCLAQKTCNEYNLSGEMGWAGGFVEYMFDYIANHNAGLQSLDIDCFESIPNSICFSTTGLYHTTTELIPAFYNYCLSEGGNVDYTKWTNDHEAFLENAVEPCFDELGNSGLISWLFAQSSKFFTLYNIRNIRQQAQDACQVYSFFGNTNDLITSLAPPPSQNEIFLSELYDSSELKIISSDFFLKVGESYQLNTTFFDGTDTLDLTNENSGTQYFLNVDSSIATINESGVISINSTYLPLVKSRALIYVYAANNVNAGIGQFAIYDEDDDSDAIVNSYEEKIGLLPNNYNSMYSDIDFDQISDFYEAMFSTNPSNPDTDNDLFNDAFEIYALSDPKDENSIPVDITTSTFEPSRINENLKIKNLFPVPTTNNITIEIESTNRTAIEISLIDLLGRTLKLKEVKVTPSTSELFQFSLKDLENGIYLIKFTDQEGSSVTKKIIKTSR